MKHAILVMAHGNLTVLQKCMEILDDERFDFFIHIDAKSKDDGKWLSTVCQKSKVYFTERIPAYWGECSLVKATLVLLKNAIHSGEVYTYYHLISAVDMPLKTPEEICRFFAERPLNEEYVTCRGKEGSHDWRMKYNYPFLKLYRPTKKKILNDIQKALYARILRFPRKAGTSILRDKGWNVYMGDQWWSITEPFARVILDMEQELLPFWEGCYASDETFAQTILMHHPDFKERQSKRNTRLIDWSRGRPYVYQPEDFELLMASPALFARKFNPGAQQVVQMIYDAVMERKRKEN